jgi:hypothetical protein
MRWLINIRSELFNIAIFNRRNTKRTCRVNTKSRRRIDLSSEEILRNKKKHRMMMMILIISLRRRLHSVTNGTKSVATRSCL